MPRTYKSGAPNPSATLCLSSSPTRSPPPALRETATAGDPVLGLLAPRWRDPQAAAPPPVTNLRRLLLSPSSGALPAGPQVVVRKARAATAADLTPSRGPKQRRPRYEWRPWFEWRRSCYLAAPSSSGAPVPGSDSDDGRSGTLTSSPPRFGATAADPATSRALHVPGQANTSSTLEECCGAVRPAAPLRLSGVGFSCCRF